MNTCEHCRYHQGGRGRDWTLYGPEGGDLILDASERLCYEPDAELKCELDTLGRILIDAVRKEKGEERDD
jgi:hypothetical protein